MDALAVTLGNQRFLLRSTARARFERQLVSAVRHGGGIVKLTLLDGSSVDALISPGLFATVAPVHVDDPADSPIAFEWPELDWEIQQEV